MSNGQPAFSEISASGVVTPEDAPRFEPIPLCEITPGPSSIELWRIDRERDFGEMAIEISNFLALPKIVCVWTKVKNN